jgi:hypothetical protein
MFLEASRENLQIIYHPTVIGGSWQQNEQKLIALSCLTATPTAIQIPKSIKQIQTKAPLINNSLLKPNQDLKSVKCNTSYFEFKNIILLLTSLLFTFITLPSTDPVTTAREFISKLYGMNSAVSYEESHLTATPVKTPDDHPTKTEPTKEIVDTPVTSLKSNNTNPNDNVDTTLIKLCSHILQFLYLRIRGNIISIHYTISSDPKVNHWHEKLTLDHLKATPTNFITTSSSLEHQSSDNDTSNTNSSHMSIKNQHVSVALQKISENLDQNAIHAREDSECKEPTLLYQAS